MDLRLISEVSQIEEDLFPSVSLNDTFQVDGLERLMTSFSPTSQFKMGIYDSEVLSKLQENSTVLEIGVGEGALAKILIEGFEIPAKNITAADLSLENFHHTNGCNQIEFNMLKEWPEHLQKYDYITFPSSFGVATGWARYLESFSPINHCIEFANLISKDLIDDSEHINDQDLQKFLELAKFDTQDALEKATFVLKQASNHLKENGQIRITKHGLNTFHQAYVLHNLRKQEIFLQQLKATEDLLVLRLT